MPSALTYSVRQLEDALDVLLFDRSSRQAVLTSAGQELLHEVWGPQYSTETNYLRVYISHLRQKLEIDSAHPQYLITELGMGYRFVTTELG